MDVATSKPSAELRGRIPHHLIDIVDPDQPFDVADWRHRALDSLADIASRGRVAIVCGGTGLYLRSLLFGLFDGPPADAALRERLAGEERKRAGTLHSRLAEVDSASAARIHANDLVRLVRALEVFETTGDTLTAWHARHGLAERPFDTLVLEVTLPREDLHRRIDARAKSMVAAGLLDEVRALGRRYDLDLKAFSAIGYREARACLRGDLAEDALASAVARATRAYAKRQRVWLRGQMSTVPVPTGDLVLATRAIGAIELASEFLA
jgi:tRNA dimethylallyltransferase